MAGQPKYLALDHKIQELGGTDWMCEQFSAGLSLRAIARQLDSSHFQIQTWIRRRPPAERHAINAIRAAEHVEDAIEQVDAADSPSAMSIARERARIRTWAAERIDREAWGQQGPAPSTTINVNTLHLTALQQLTGQGNSTAYPRPEHHGELARARAGDGGLLGSGEVRTGVEVGMDENHNPSDERTESA